MMTLEECLTRLQTRNLSQVARDTKICRLTLSRLRSGHIEDPRYWTIKTLSDYLQVS